MGKDVIHADLEKFLAGHIRSALAQLAGNPASEYQALADGVFVADRFPDPRRDKTVVVRDDGGPTTGLTTRDATVGVTVLAGEDETDGLGCADLALLVHAIVRACAGPESGNPVAAVRQMAGPFKVRDPSGQPRRYFTADLALVGKEIKL